MKRVFLVHGLKRSGNHAVINWIASQGEFTFINNAIPIAPILRGEAAIPPVEPFASWFASRPQSLENHRDSLIVSLEDHGLAVKPFREPPCEVWNLLILRKPSNLFASRIQKAFRFENHPAYPKVEGAAMDRVIGLWKAHAREYLGFSNHLDNRTGIYFDRWFSSRPYRQRLSERLGLEFSDRGIFRVPDTGGGSSFDATRFDGNNQAMDVLDRKKLLTGNNRRLLAKVLEDTELDALARQIEAR